MKANPLANIPAEHREKFASVLAQIHVMGTSTGSRVTNQFGTTLAAEKAASRMVAGSTVLTKDNGGNCRMFPAEQSSLKQQKQEQSGPNPNVRPTNGPAFTPSPSR